MALTVTAPARPAGESASTEKWLLAFLIAAICFIPINQLRVEWSINAQYAYGWAVPFLALYLFGERWKRRPLPRPARSGRLLAPLAALLALSLLPARLIEEAAPDWRLISWVLAGTCLALLLCGITYAGGKPWLRHFIFPICFFLVAVPWPVPFEQAIVQRLMRCVASLCVEALGWWGVPAVQEGNVIRISSGSVGVEEACSGVRSLQTTLMIALFLGELFRFNLWRRSILLVSGLILAFACNVGRALVLVWLYATRGVQSFHQFHDAVGLGVLVASLGGLGAIAQLLRRGTGPPEQPAPADGGGNSSRAIPRVALIFILAWLGVVEAGTETWYRIHDRANVKATAWTIDFPVQLSSYRDLQIPEITQTVLRYNEGRAGAWTDAGGNSWSMSFLRWFPGRASVQLARSHGPEICLPAGGIGMQSDLGVGSLPVRGVDLAMHSYIFLQHGRPLYVFYTLAEDRPANEPASTRHSMTFSNRLEEVWTGRRNQGQQVLEISVQGPADAAEARAATIQMLGQLIRPAPSLARAQDR
jgi:exosortase